MMPSITPHRIDLFEAVRYDIRLHGFRFMAAELTLAALGAFALVIVELLHAAHGGAPLMGALWFLSVAFNCLAVVYLALQVRRSGTHTYIGDRRLQWYALELVVMLLIPLAVVLATLQQWHAGDFRPGSVPAERGTS